MFWFQLIRRRIAKYVSIDATPKPAVLKRWWLRPMCRSSRRERCLSGGPAGSRGKGMYTPRVIMQAATRPEWALRMLANGGCASAPWNPTMIAARTDDAEFIGSQLNGGLDWDYLDLIRDRWKGKLLLKGILHGQDAERAVRQGCDALVISNHGGRQLDAAPHPLHQLPHIRAVVGKKVPLIVDSGIRSGLDVAKAIASGADFVLIGRLLLLSRRSATWR